MLGVSIVASFYDFSIHCYWIVKLFRQCGIFSFPFYSQILNIEFRIFISKVFVC